MQSVTDAFPFLKFNASETELPFTIVKYLAINQLGLQILHALEMLHETADKLIYCDHPDDEPVSIEEVEQIKTITPDVKRTAQVSSHTVLPDEDLLKKVFNWSLIDFFQRLQFDIVWINIMNVQWSPSCLELKKINTDFNELYRLLRLILQGYLNRQNFDDIFEQLREIDIYNHILDAISREFELNRAQSDVQLQSQASMRLIGSSVHLRDARLNPFEKNLVDAAEFRYELNFHRSQVYQAEMQSKHEESTLDQKKLHMIKKHEREQQIFNTVASNYELQIENLHYRLTLMTCKYDEDFKDASESVVANKLKIKNLKLRRQYLEEQIDRFREEIELVSLQKQKRIDQELERLRLIEKKKLEKAESFAAKKREKAKAKREKFAQMLKALREAGKKR